MRFEKNTGPVRRQGGLAAVEFAIILPVILLLMMATAELGRAFYLSNTLTKMVRSGTRYLAENAIEGTTGRIKLDENLIRETRNMVLYGTPGEGTPLLEDIAADAISVDAIDATHVQVSVSFNFKPIFTRIPTFGLGAGDIQLDYPLRATATMRAL